MSWDGKFNGTYESSRYYGDGSLENDIMNSGCGIRETSTGGLYRQGERIDVWGRGDDHGNYDHYYYNTCNDYGKAPDGRHD